jgi:hypothetical protein
VYSDKVNNPKSDLEELAYKMCGQSVLDKAKKPKRHPTVAAAKSKRKSSSTKENKQPETQRKKGLKKKKPITVPAAKVLKPTHNSEPKKKKTMKKKTKKQSNMLLQKPAEPLHSDNGSNPNNAIVTELQQVVQELAKRMEEVATTNQQLMAQSSTNADENSQLRVENTQLVHDIEALDAQRRLEVMRKELKLQRGDEDLALSSDGNTSDPDINEVVNVMSYLENSFQKLHILIDNMESKRGSNKNH